ncbi:MOSC domain-containing protein YiiM [Robiginitalea myxolifaciens]|uniref:MOSC domain-containing protein YiiM n=1 Tax=Robiginitalea myxolifaciens TaxID=400055 RepID=A0A1I6FNR5_9FLAO|nr:MOSC domain-containing protein [Robiginitalea myxolifaciens]SFR31579.1 MOSC domain-containing protein YiiM [Robiginitalea myxolifaciens]
MESANTPRVVSTNIAQPTEIQWRGKTEITGIYKRPKALGVYLTPEGVRGDTIGDRRVHGDIFKAAYLFNTDNYPYWQDLYPDLEWDYGQFGENLSLAGLDEQKLIPGSEYQLGEARVRVTIPREPCYKLGIRFSDPEVIERFVAHGKPGTYVQVLESGWVRPGDTLTLLKKSELGISIAAYYALLFSRDKPVDQLKAALEVPFLGDRKRKLFEGMLAE